MVQNGKSSLKAPAAAAAAAASLNGNDDGSEKSRRGRKVQFDSEDMPEAKFDMPNGKGDSIPNGKGGKGAMAANGGKPTMSKVSYELRVEEVLPKNAKCLMDCEAAEILQGIDERMIVLSEDPSIKIPTSFVRGLKYAKSAGRYANPQAVRQVLEPLKKHGISDSEICVIANICSESVDEVFALMPSLTGKKNKLADPLKVALGQLALLKQSS